MKIKLLYVLILLSSVSLFAQLPKKELKALEKQAKEIPAGGLRIDNGSPGYIKTIDSVFGRLSVPDTSGWKAYSAFVIEGKEVGDFIHGSIVSPYMQVAFRGFYMSATEVSNGAYQMYENWLRQNQPDSVNDALPDSALWGMWQYIGSPYISYYYRHPVYRNSPLVNIRHDQALKYLSWLTEQYSSSPGRKYKRVRFRLPTEEEWMYAYLGGEHENQVTHFGWFRNRKGQMTANFTNTSPSSVIQLQDFDSLYLNDGLTNPSYLRNDVVNGLSLSDFLADDLNSRYDYLAPCESYWPNKYGLWNMAGNVAEFVAVDGIVKGGHWSTTGYYLLPLSRETYLGQNSASPTRGFRWVMEVIEE